MQDFGTKSDDTAGPSGQLSAAEFNNLATEAENAVLRSGQPLSGASETQLATSLFLHGTKSQAFQDNGAANAYVATPASGASGVLLPVDYTALNGSIIILKASSANTGASTLNFGQTTGTLLGTKAIVQPSGAALTSGLIAANAYIQLRYDSSIGAGSWVLLPWSTSSGRYLGTRVITATGTYTPTSGTNKVVVTLVGGGAAGGGAGTTNASQFAAGAGGGGGGPAKALISAGFSGVTVTIGAGGVGIAANDGGSGGATSFGTLMSGGGGSGGNVGVPTTSSLLIGGGPSGVGSIPVNANVTPIFSGNGTNGTFGIAMTSTNFIAGLGGSSIFGGGGAGRSGTTGLGTAATSYGCGGGGSANGVSSASSAGAAGFAGVVIIEEYS